MRIALCSNALVDPRPSGTKTFLLELLRAWAKNHGGEMTVTLVVGGRGQAAQLSALLPNGPWKLAEDHRALWPARLGWLVGAGSLSPTIGRHDVYLSGWHWPLGRRDEPFVGIVHDLAPLESQPCGVKPWIYRRLFLRSLEAAVRRAAFLVAISQYTLDRLSSEVSGRLPRHRVIPHGIDLRRWSGDRRPATKRYVLALGQHTRNKNFLTLLRAFHRWVLPVEAEAELVLAGGYNTETEGLRRYVARHGLEDRVRLPGFVDDDRIPELVRGAAVVAVPSFVEGFGLPVLEAFAAGVPVVCSRGSALVEVAGDAAVLVEPSDEGEMGSALASLLEDPALWRRMADRGSERARTMSWQRCAEAYWEVLTEVAGRS